MTNTKSGTGREKLSREAGGLLINAVHREGAEVAGDPRFLVELSDLGYVNLRDAACVRELAATGHGWAGGAFLTRAGVIERGRELTRRLEEAFS